MKYETKIALIILGVALVTWLFAMDYIGGADEFRIMTVQSKLHVPGWTEYQSGTRTVRDSDGRAHEEPYTTSISHPERWLLYTQSGDEIDVTRAQWATTKETQSIIFGRKIGRITHHAYNWRFLTQQVTPE